MWEDHLGTLEVSRTQAAVERLSNEPWAQPLIRRLEEQGWPSVESRPLMFEARFGEALADAAVDVEYEYSAGVGESTVDFRTVADIDWLIELVSLQETDAASWRSGRWV